MCEIARSSEVQLTVGTSCLASLRNATVSSFENLLFVWPTGSSEPLPPLELPFAPATMCSFENYIFLATSDAAIVCSVTTESAGELNVLRTLETPDGSTLFPLISHSTFSLDGSTIAVCSQNFVFLLTDVFQQQGESAEGGNDADREDRDDFELVNCLKWFGHNDAVLTAFGPSHLFVLSKNNHLVSFLLSADESGNSADDDTAGNFLTFAVDGQFVCPSSSNVTAMCADPFQGNLLLSNTSGTIIVLQQDSLSAVYTIPLQTIMKDHFSKRRENILAKCNFDEEAPKCPEDEKYFAVDLTTIHLTVLEIALVSRDYFVVITSVGWALFSRASLVAVPGAISFFGKVAGCSAVSACGVVSVWFPFQKCLAQTQLAFNAKQLVDSERSAEASLGDIVHASRPLPRHIYDGKDPTAVLLASLKKDPKDKPITFGKSISSSGYTSSVPWSVQQAQKAKLKLQQNKAKAKSTTQLKYDCSCGPPTAPLQKANETLAKNAIHHSIVSSLKFDATGSYLTSGSGDTTIHMLKCPVAKNSGDGICARGHASMVNSVDVGLTLQHPLIASGSFDGTVALWRPTKRESPYVQHVAGKEVKTVCFGYMDNLLAFSSGSSLYFAQCIIDEGGGDLERKRNQSRLNVVHTVATTAQQVNAFDWVNSFASTVVVWGGSNKQIGVYDLAVEKDIRVIEDAHSRPIHSVEMMRNSRFATDVSSDALHLFATASLDKTVRLWDLRQEAPARQFSSHSNSAVRVGMCLSPCGKFLVVGSEDRAAYVYSVDQGTVLAKLPATDTVTAIRFHPIERSVVALGSANGDIKLWGMKQ